MRRPAAYLAIAAMALNALWPLVAQAGPGKSPFVAVVCATGEGLHVVDLTGKLPDSTHDRAEHCKLCVSAGERVIADVAGIFPRFEAFRFEAEKSVHRTAYFQSAPYTVAPARGPPALS